VKLTKWKWIGITTGCLVLSIASAVSIVTYTGENIYPNKGKKHAMLRLEDVGLGGQYDTLEGLGKLRAVIEYIESERIPFHVAVISRRMSIEEDGTWLERGIDDPNPDPLARSFIRILQDAERSGGLLGMHGYSHQYGDTARSDYGQNSGTGSEFKVSGAPVTKEPSYAAERISASLAAFAMNGLTPAFWESPHYRNTREQEKVFRSHIGLLYQPDLYSLRSFKDLTAYDTVNRYGHDSLGSVYVPAPYKYVSDEASVDRLLERAQQDDALASMYFHPFLDFPYLEEVTGEDGKTVMEDGLPVYRYRQDGPPSHLHRIIPGFRQMGYRWMSLFDIIPYSPAHRVMLPAGTGAQQVMLGDVRGVGHEDVVVREAHRITVIPGRYEWPRNRAQEAGQVWLQAAFRAEDQSLLTDLNEDGRADLLVYDRLSGQVRTAIAGDGHYQALTAIGDLPAGLDAMQPMQVAGEAPYLLAREGKELVLIRVELERLTRMETGISLPEDAVLYSGSFDRVDRAGVVVLSASQPEPILFSYMGDGSFAQPKPLSGIRTEHGDQLLTGDSNGDGWDDLVVYRAKSGVWRVYENDGEGAYLALDNDYGPWASGQGRVGFMADIDGNGRDDIGSYDTDGRALDLSLSFRGMTP
jgi:hypothetical protein